MFILIIFVHEIYFKTIQQKNDLRVWVYFKSI